MEWKRIDTILVENESKNMKLLDYFLAKYCPQIQVIGKAKTKKKAVELIDQLKPKLIMLDIQLDDGTGFDVLDAAQHKDYRVIFVTSFSKYATKAFRYNAIDYILKPVAIEELIVAVNKAHEYLQKEWYTSPRQISSLSENFNVTTNFDFIAVPSIDKIEFLKINEIAYLKSEGRYTVFKLVDGSSVMASKNLGEFENIIDKSLFFRIHNSYIVNLKHILKINKVDGSYCEMSTNEALPIAKRRQDSLSRFLRIK